MGGDVSARAATAAAMMLAATPVWRRRDHRDTDTAMGLQRDASTAMVAHRDRPASGGITARARGLSDRQVRHGADAGSGAPDTDAVWHGCGLAQVRSGTGAAWHRCGLAQVRLGTDAVWHGCGLAQVRSGMDAARDRCGLAWMRFGTDAARDRCGLVRCAPRCVALCSRTNRLTMTATRERRRVEAHRGCPQLARPADRREVRVSARGQ